MRLGTTHHMDFEAAVEAQLKRVREGGDDEQATVIGHGVGKHLRVEAWQVEAVPAVLDRSGSGSPGLELQRDLNILLSAAMAHGVGGCFFYTENKIVDCAALGAVLAQIVTNAL